MKELLWPGRLGDSCVVLVQCMGAGCVGVTGLKPLVDKTQLITMLLATLMLAHAA